MTALDATVQLSDLRDQPRFLATVADRLWNAWWREEGVALSAIEARLAEGLAPGTIPSTLVAHAGELFLGTVSITDHDLAERPELTPWVAALWVDAQYRTQGLGTSLLSAATQAVFSDGVGRVYLCASPENSPFYLRLGWQLIEESVAGLNVFVLSC